MASAARSAAGWLLTAGGVIVIIFLVGGDHEFSGAATVIVAVVAGIALLVPFAVGAAYMAVRRRNRAAEATSGQSPVSPRARAATASISCSTPRLRSV